MRNSIVTLFGGSGFIGRRIVARLAARHATIRVVTRDPERAGHLRPLGKVGQIVLLPLHNDSVETITKLVAGASHVVNLVGVLFERQPEDFSRYHAKLAETIAECAAAHQVQRLVQFSAIGASAQSSAKYGRSKAAGELSVRAAFADATILRPSIVVGGGDGFFGRFAEMARISPILPLIDGGTTKFQPVFVDDVAEAAERCLCDGAGTGATYELGGPTVYTFKELLTYMMSVTGQRRMLLNLPVGIAKLQARLLERLPQPPLTRDQIAMLAHDNVVSADALTLADLGVQATPIEVVIPRYLRAFARPSVQVPAD